MEDANSPQVGTPSSTVQTPQPAVEMPFDPSLSPTTSCKSGGSPSASLLACKSEDTQVGDEPNPNVQRVTVEGSIRKRVYRACEVCRRKKVKCNGQKPCGHCIAFAEECFYVDTKDRSAYSRRYVESLEHRLAKMEQALSFAHEGHKNLGSRSLGSSPINSGPRPIETYIDYSHGLSSAFSLVTTTNQCYAGSLQTGPNGDVKYLGPSSAVALIEEANRVLDLRTGRGIERAASVHAHQDLSWFQDGVESNADRISLDEARAELPQEDILNRLIDAFFCQAYPIFPVVSHHDLMQLVTRIMFSSNRDEHVDSVSLSLIFAVLACGERMLKDGKGRETSSTPLPSQLMHLFQREQGSRKDSEAESIRAAWAAAGGQYFQKSHRLILQGMSEAKLVSVQVYALQAFYMAASSSAARSWILTGNAMRLAMHLGMHRNLDHASLNDTERELRKRVWWCVYMLDRLLGVAIGRPFGIEDENVDAAMPTAEDDSFADLAPGFVALVSLSRTSGRIARTAACLEHARDHEDEGEEQILMARARAHEGALDAWFESLPPSLKVQYPNNEHPLAIQSCIAFLSLHSTRLHLLQALQRKTDAAGGVALLSENEKRDLAKCTQTTLQIIRSSNRVAKTVPPSPWLFDYINCLLMSGGFLALNAAKQKNANTAQLLTETEEAINGFRLVEKTLPGARYHRKALSRLLRRVREQLAVSSATSAEKRGVEGPGGEYAEGPMNKRRRATIASVIPSKPTVRFDFNLMASEAAASGAMDDGYAGDASQGSPTGSDVALTSIGMNRSTGTASSSTGSGSGPVIVPSSSSSKPLQNVVDGAGFARTFEDFLANAPANLFTDINFAPSSSSSSSRAPLLNGQSAIVAAGTAAAADTTHSALENHAEIANFSGLFTDFISQSPYHSSIAR